MCATSLIPHALQYMNRACDEAGEKPTTSNQVGLSYEIQSLRGAVYL